MIRENQKILNIINVFLDGVLIFLAVVAAFHARFYILHGKITEPFSRYLIIVLFDIPMQLILFGFLGLYEPRRKKQLYKELTVMFAAISFNFAAMFMILYFTKDFDFSRLAMALFFTAKNILLGGKRIALRLFLRYIRKSGFNQKHVLIVGSNVMAKSCYAEILKHPELGYNVQGYVSRSSEWKNPKYLGNLDDLAAVMKKLPLDEVFVSLDAEDHPLLDKIIYLCDLNGVRFSFIPYYSQFMSAGIQLDSLNGIPVFSLRKLPLDNLGNAFVKRAVDIVGSAVLIALTSPIMLAVAIGVRLSSPGPIIFRQERVGLGKQPFMMYKFRSMRVNAEQSTGWSTNNDPRKTRFGSFIRKYSLDELPQFFNVLKGDMSLVGPRPEIPHFVSQFRDEVPQYLSRQQVRPGITGWAQVNGLRGDTSIPDRVRYDRWYIENWNLWLDLDILLRTVFGGFMNSEVIADTSKDEKEESKAK